MNIKVCGITTVKQLQQLDGLDIAFAGLVFDQSSPRYAGDKLKSKEIIGLDTDIKKVGVFVNAEYTEITDIAEQYELDLVELHGDEDPELCADLSEELEVVKAFKIGADTKSVDQLIREYDDACDYYLFDSAEEGKKFDWKKITESKIEKPFFLSGSIGPADAKLVKKFKHPDFFGISINSLFEKEPGTKDMALILKFLQDLK